MLLKLNGLSQIGSMQDSYRRENYLEMVQELQDLLDNADMPDPYVYDIDFEKVIEFISQYSPNSAMLKQVIFENKDFCRSVKIKIMEDRIDSMLNVSLFIEKNHNAYSHSSFKP